MPNNTFREEILKLHSWYINNQIILHPDRNNIFVDKVETLIHDSQRRLVEEIKKDMLVKMKDWHGTGKAMVEDYFINQTLK